MSKSVVAALCLLVASAVSAAEQKATKGDLAQASVAGSAIVAKDPVTGELRQPTAAEVQELTKSVSIMARRPRGAAAVNSAADGTLTAQLDESTLNVTVAVRHADGEVAHVCVHGFEAAMQAIAAGAVTTTPEEK